MPSLLPAFRYLARSPAAAVLWLGTLSACGGSQPAGAAAPDTTAPETPTAPASARPDVEGVPSAAADPSRAAETSKKKPEWDELSAGEKQEIMTTSVLPTMKGHFQEFDPKRFADFGCATCHGPSAKAGKFSMPNPLLPKLDPANDFAKHVKKDPKIVKFMMERVEPEVARLIGEPPYDPVTHAGFGCFECHTEQGK